MKVGFHPLKENPHRTVSDLVDLDDGLVAGAAATTDDEGGGYDDADGDGHQDGGVLDGFGGVLDGADQFLRFALYVIPADCQPRASIR